MCQFFSAIIMRDGNVLWHEATDSHSDLIAHFGLPDNTLCAHFAKVEFTPKVDDKGVPQFGNVDDYSLRVDEDTEPAWFADMRETVTNKLRAIVASFIVNDKRPLLLGGCRILLDGADIRDVKASRVVSMSGSANVGEMSGSAKVGVMSGSANVGVMSDSARVGVMRDSARVGVMRDSAKVGEMSGSAKVGVMSDSANVGVMSVSAKVGVMWDSAKAPRNPTTDCRTSATVAAK